MNMNKNLFDRANSAPTHWKNSGDYSTLHQLAPYIGKLKPAIARDLILRFTNSRDVVLDCFSGSGTVALEATLLGRHALAFDSNPYAVTLTRAKLEAPTSPDQAFAALQHRLRYARERPEYPLRSIPAWVSKFFHPHTLQNALRFADECIERDDQFLLACLLGILHHQRPGFLSYPSSHLVPYLRTKKYPADEFPAMYEERTLEPRLTAKVTRALKSRESIPMSVRFVARQSSIEALHLEDDVDAIITSPPYMNALDYVRDNRLRLWFLDRRTENYSSESTDRTEQFSELTGAFMRNALSRLRPGGRCVLVVGEAVVRKRRRSHPAELMCSQLLALDSELRLEEVISDEIPDVRRSRREGAATKRELIIVLRKLSRPIS